MPDQTAGAPPAAPRHAPLPAATTALHVAGDRVEILVDAAGSGGTVTLVHVTVPQGGAVPAREGAAPAAPACGGGRARALPFAAGRP